MAQTPGGAKPAIPSISVPNPGQRGATSTGKFLHPEGQGNVVEARPHGHPGFPECGGPAGTGVLQPGDRNSADAHAPQRILGHAADIPRLLALGQIPHIRHLNIFRPQPGVFHRVPGCLSPQLHDRDLRKFSEFGHAYSNYSHASHGKPPFVIP